MMDEPNRLIGIKELVEMLGISESTLTRMIKEGRIPKPLYIAPRCPRWWLSDILKWLASLA